MRNLFKNFDIEHLIERFMEHIDIEEITRDVMSTLIIKDIDIYFVVEPIDADEIVGYKFLGMAYSEAAARELADSEDADRDRAKIFRFDMGKLVSIVERLGGAELCERDPDV